MVNQLKQKLQTKEMEMEKLVKDSAQVEKDYQSRCQKMEDMVKKLQDGWYSLFLFLNLLVKLQLHKIWVKFTDYLKLKSDYDVLYASNLKTVTRSQDIERDFKELEVYNILMLILIFVFRFR